MKKWILSAVLILAAVTGTYAFYESRQPAGASDGHHAEADGGSGHGEHGQHHEGEEKPVSGDAVTAHAAYQNETIAITLQDQNQKPFSNLLVNHEKIMHLIVVSEDLTAYRHLHPEKTGDGKYEVKQNLPDGRYKAFVDIKPEKADYKIKPVRISAGASGERQQSKLIPDKTYVQRSSEYEAKMSPAFLKENEPAALTFTFNKGTPEPYLGAAGHVVILDEKGEQFLHVHPLSEKETKFETTFKKPGTYKIWAEFKFEGKVHVFPYTVEVEES